LRAILSVPTRRSSDLDIIEAFRLGFDHDAFAQCVDALTEARRIFTLGLGPGSMVAGFLAIHLKRVGFDAEALMNAGYRLADDLLDRKSTRLNSSHVSI